MLLLRRVGRLRISTTHSALVPSLLHFMMRYRRRALLVLAVLHAGAPTITGAQPATTIASGTAAVTDSSKTGALPLRRGQWAAQFRLASDAFGLGALRFRSPSSAWLADGGFNVETQRTSGTSGSAYTPPDDRFTATTITLRSGLRAYRPVAPGIARYHGAGLTAQYATSDSRNYLAWQGGGGPYAELGAVYFVTPHLSLGAATQAAATYTGGRQRYKVPDPDGVIRESAVTGWSFRLSGLTMLGTLYF